MYFGVVCHTVLASWRNSQKSVRRFRVLKSTEFRLDTLCVRYWNQLSRDTFPYSEVLYCIHTLANPLLSSTSNGHSRCMPQRSRSMKHCKRESLSTEKKWLEKVFQDRYILFFFNRATVTALTSCNWDIIVTPYSISITTITKEDKAEWDSPTHQPFCCFRQPR